MTKDRTHYEVLGVTQKAPPEIITAVYRAWMQTLKMHPDLGGDENIAKEINAAYDTLKDPERRAQYDARIEAWRPEGESEPRRRAPRTSVVCDIAFCIPPDGSWLPAQTVDVSSMGLKVRTARELIEGGHISIAFPSSVASAVEAYVRWSKKLVGVDGWMCECGLEFFNPIPDIINRLKGAA